MATRLVALVKGCGTKTRWGSCVTALLAAVAVAVLTAWALDPWPSERVGVPSVSRLLASRSIEEARLAGAQMWAPLALRRAEEDLRQAEEEVRRQEVRPRPLRDFRVARARFHEALRSATVAKEEALHARSRAESASEAGIRDAANVVDQAERSAGLARLKAGPRKYLENARQALAEARLHHREGQYGLARDRAETASWLAHRVLEAVIARVERYADKQQREAWSRMVAETVSWSAQTGRMALVVSKEEHEVILYQAGKPVRTFRADIGRERVDDKWQAGDAATPEGRYRIIKKKGPKDSRYYKALLLDYPNTEDRKKFERLKRQGLVPKGASLGGLIEIHGHGGQGRDWTDGCVALSNADMDVLFEMVPEGTPVTIVGSDDGSGPLTDLVRVLREQLESTQ